MIRKQRRFISIFSNFMTVVGTTALVGCASAPIGHDKQSQIGKDFLPSSSTSIPTSEQAVAGQSSSSNFDQAIVIEGNASRPSLANSNVKRKWQPRGGSIQLNLVDTPVRDAAKLIIEDQLGSSVIVDSEVQGNISFGSGSGYSKQDLVPAFNVLLGKINARIEPEGEGYRIRKGASSPSISLSGNLDIVPLRHIGANEFAKVLSSHGINSTAIASGNMIVVSGSPQKLRSIRRLAKTFDVNWLSNQSLAIIPIENWSVVSLLEKLNETVLSGETDGTGTLRVAALERSNSLLISAPSIDTVRSVKAIAEKMDKSAMDSQDGFFVYRVKNGKASDLAKLAQQMFTSSYVGDEDNQDQESAAFPQGTRIFSDESTNSVVVSGTHYDFVKVKKAMQQLDVRPMQVLVEARIMELTLTGELQYGLEWYLNGSRASSNTSGSLDFNVAGPDLPVPGFNYVIERAGEIRSALNAFADDSRLKVLSSPSLLVLNNRTAKIQVGDEVPIPRVQSTSNFAPEAPTVNSIEYRDTGIVLKVTPRINQGGMVTLDVSQEVSSVGRNTVSEIDAPIIQQRRLASTIAVQDGQTVVLGGLIQEREFGGDSGVPVLKDIPAVGKLFSTTTDQIRRTELVALLTPKVVRNYQDLDSINREYLDSFRGLREIRLGE